MKSFFIIDPFCLKGYAHDISPEPIDVKSRTKIAAFGEKAENIRTKQNVHKLDLRPKPTPLLSTSYFKSARDPAAGEAFCAAVLALLMVSSLENSGLGSKSTAPICPPCAPFAAIDIALRPPIHFRHG
jgi:hypothetical protein